MSAIANLVVKLGAQTRGFDRAMQRSRGGLNRLGTAAGATGAMIQSALMPLAGVAGLVKLTTVGEQFNRKMRQSTAIMGDLSQAMRVDMRQAAFAVAKDTKFAASEVAQSYYFLVSAGLDARRSIAALPQVATFAQAGMFDLARATDILTDAQSAMGLASADAAKHMTNMGRVGDVVVAAAKKANASVEQFGEALMNKGALAAKLAGMELEEVTAILMVMADKGFAKGAEGGQAVWMALRDLKTKAVENKAAFWKMGIAVDAGGGKMAKMADIMEDMTRVLGKLNPLAQQEALSKLGLPSKSLAPILTLLGEADRLRDFEKYLQRAGGTMEAVANKQLTPMQKGWAKLSATITEVASGLTKSMGPGVQGALELAAKATWGLAFAFRLLRLGAVSAEYAMVRMLASAVTVASKMPIAGRALRTVAAEIRAVAASLLEDVTTQSAEAWDVWDSGPAKAAGDEADKLASNMERAAKASEGFGSPIADAIEPLVDINKAALDLADTLTGQWSEDADLFGLEGRQRDIAAVRRLIEEGDDTYTREALADLEFLDAKLSRLEQKAAGVEFGKGLTTPLDKLERAQRDIAKWQDVGALDDNQAARGTEDARQKYLESVGLDISKKLSPQEKIDEVSSKIDEAIARGAMTFEEGERALANAREGIKSEANGSRTAGAEGKNTVGAYSRIVQAMMGRNDPQKQVVKNTAKIAASSEKTAEATQGLKALGAQSVIEIPGG